MTIKQASQQFNIVIKPNTRFGKPTIPGTRVAVEDVLRMLEMGFALEEIPEQYPHISTDVAKQAITYATAIMGKEETYTIESLHGPTA